MRKNIFRNTGTGAMLLASLAMFAFVSMVIPAQAAAQPVPRVTASTSWAGAIAEAAGADVGRILAPIEMRHPAEYDFRPGDIRYAVEADFIVWAGYEGFMRNLFQAVNIPEERIRRVHTNNTPPVLKEVVRQLSEALGTVGSFEKWEKELDPVAARLISGARLKNAAGTRAVVHAHHKVLAEWLGYNIVAELGMSELTPAKLREILAAKPDIIIDNWHMPTGEPLKGEGRNYLQLINFPGQGGTETLLDVLRYNGKLLGILE